MAVENINSTLIADLGNAHTRLVLIDLVEGRYRLIASTRARTTAQPPLENVSLGLEHAAQGMTSLIGRELISREPDQLFLMPEQGGHGVDTFLATGSVGRPMRVFLVGLTPEISMASGQRVLAGSYVTITDSLCPDDLRSDEDKINAVLRSEPDMILIVGGTDDGADDILMDQVQLVFRALSLIRRGTMPTVLFAGNKALHAQVRRLLHPVTDVYFARNVRPTLEDEQLFPAQLELALVYDDYRSKSAGGFTEAGRHSRVGIVPTSQGYISAMRYMSMLSTSGLGPMCVDIGSANSMIVASVRDQVHYGIRSDLGMGHHLLNALETITPAILMRWLPFEIDEDNLLDYVHNKMLRPTSVPATPEELMIEQAFAREILRLMVEEQRPTWDQGRSELLPHFNPIIAAGAILTEAPHPGISALVLLDALQPAGIADLRLDPHNLVSALGVVAYLNPAMTVQALESGGLVNLGTAFCPVGQVRYGRDAMAIQIRRTDGRVLTHNLQSGDMWIAPLLPGVTAEVSIQLRRGLTINGKRRIRQRVTAGAAGIIFDARGRPFVLPRPRDRAARYMRWQLAMSGRDVMVAAAAGADASADAVPVPDLDDLTDLGADLDVPVETSSEA